MMFAVRCWRRGARPLLLMMVVVWLLRLVSQAVAVGLGFFLVLWFTEGIAGRRPLSLILVLFTGTLLLLLTRHLAWTDARTP